MLNHDRLCSRRQSVQYSLQHFRRMPVKRWIGMDGNKMAALLYMVWLTKEPAACATHTRTASTPRGLCPYKGMLRTAPSPRLRLAHPAIHPATSCTYLRTFLGLLPSCVEECERHPSSRTSEWHVVRFCCLSLGKRDDGMHLRDAL